MVSFPARKPREERIPEITAEIFKAIPNGVELIDVIEALTFGLDHLLTEARETVKEDESKRVLALLESELNKFAILTCHIARQLDMYPSP